MIDIKNLEKKWLHYKLKKYIPFTLIFITLIIIISIITLSFKTTLQSTKNTIKNTTETLTKIPKKHIKVDKTIKNTPKKVIKKHKTIQKKHKISSVKIKTVNTKKSFQYIINRFKKNHNPILGLFIAKKYYTLKNYKQSYNYALITNNINNKLEGSWIIFAKSLIKLKQKNRAINVLKDYIKSSDSKHAKLLLDRIEKGKFKGRN